MAPKAKKTVAQTRAELERQKRDIDAKLAELDEKRRGEIGKIAEAAGALGLPDDLIREALKEAAAKYGRQFQQ